MSAPQKFRDGSGARPQGMWARRKTGVKAEAEALALAEKEKEVAAEQAELEDKTDAEILTDLNLRDPDEMQAGDDFSVFMKSAIPERLRRRALRKLWLTDPVLANIDGLVDYGDDFTDAACVLENLKTSYQVGKGLLKHVEEIERQKKEAATMQAADPAEDEQAEEQEPLLATSADDVEPLESEPEPADAEFIVEAETEQVEPPFIRRKMRFAFAE